MKRTFLYLSIGAAAVLPCVLVSCGDVALCDNHRCDSPDAGGDETSVIEGGGLDAMGDVTPPGCDAGADPKDSPACVASSFGVFVSASAADDTGDGSREHPVKTIATALGKTNAGKSRVYVCEGTYAQQVTLASTVSMYGGFDCGTWAYGMKSVKVAPTAAGIALSITASNVTVEDIEFDAKDGAAAGDSSIAIFASNAQNVIFRRVTAMSGAGHDGADPAAKTNYNEALAASDPSIKGHDATTDLGALLQTCTSLCTNGVSSLGGAGGFGVVSGGTSGSGADGGPAIPASPPGADGIGGAGKLVGCNTSDPGANAAGAAGGALAAQKPGTLAGSGWTRTDGSSSAVAGPGQGGGGGSGGSHAGATNNGGGGGGGCGGCGGAGGAGGMSGGSSFAVVSFMSSVTLDTCTLKSGKGGTGKAGGAGEVGQTGGAKGLAPAAGCDGAAGGQGGAGAGGGGGAGGDSIAVGYVGSGPTEVGTNTKQPSTAGTGGAGGTGGAPPAGTGANGTAAPSQAL